MKFNMLVLMLLFSHHAMAGAYNHLCSNPSGTILINKSEAKIGSFYIQSAYQAAPVEYQAINLNWNFSTDHPKNLDTAVVIEAVGKSVILTQKKQTDRCGNVGEKLIRASEVMIKSLKSGKTIVQDYLVCDESYFMGHCD